MIRARSVPQCPACGGDDHKVVVRLDAASRRRFEAFSAAKYGGLLENWLEAVPPVVCRCLQCGHHWYRHQPDEEALSLMYEHGRSLGANLSPARGPSPVMLAEMRRLFTIALSRGVDRPRLLDFGSGYGRWARAAVAAGFTVTAFEPNQARGGEAAAPFELVHDLAALSGRQFDIIMLEQVLEHVSDPRALLQRLADFCAPRAVVRVTVPNICRAPEGKQLWEVWPFDGVAPHTMAPFEHLHGFSPGSLSALLARAGFAALPFGEIARYYPREAARIVVGVLLPGVQSTFRLVEKATEAI